MTEQTHEEWVASVMQELEDDHVYQTNVSDIPIVRAPQRKARELYVNGQEFRVIRDGARLEGIRGFGVSSKAWAGFSRKLVVGDIVTCDGWRSGMGSPAELVNFTSPKVPDHVLWAAVWPLASLFRPYPMPGYLEPINRAGEEN